MSSDPDDINEQIGTRKRISIVWSYFDKLSRWRVRCKLCWHEQNFQGTTGNILRHLKNKHQIDATLKGQKENCNGMKNLRDNLLTTNENESNEQKNEAASDKESLRPIRRTTLKVESYIGKPDRDIYSESVEHFGDFVNPNNSTDNIKIPNENIIRTSANSVQEEHIIAETEYFREKAAYYRMQTNLTALQAKKIKYELEQSG